MPRTLTYRNSGTEPVTLDLTTTSPGGGSAPTGMFTVSPARLTAPAGGTAKCDPRLGDADGAWSGAVTASGDGQSVRTALGVSREVESYKLTLTVTRRDGKRDDAPGVTVAGLDTGRPARCALPGPAEHLHRHDPQRLPHRAVSHGVFVTCLRPGNVAWAAVRLCAGKVERCRRVGRREKPVDPGAGPVQRLAHDLRLLREKAGKPPYREMAKRAGYSTTALSQAAAGDQLPSLAVVRAYAQALDADPDEWEQRWREADAEVREPAADERASYRGLARFEPGDNDLFFGRDKQVGELLGLVRALRFAAVFGASGSGKSSLLRAGLIPALRQAQGADRPRWCGYSRRVNGPRAPTRARSPRGTASWTPG